MERLKVGRVEYRKRERLQKREGERRKIGKRQRNEEDRQE